MHSTAIESAIFFETPAEIYLRVFRVLKPRTAPPRLQVEFCRFANANSFVRMEGDVIQVRMTDALEGAPAPVMEALAHILLSKLFRRRVPEEFNHRYRRYLNRKDIRQRLEQLRQERGRKQVVPPAGAAYDLEQIFEELNFRYFFGLMSRPALGWSRRPSRVTLGHYDPSHHVIVISSLLDRAEVPRLVVEYVMFHEMLHLRHPVDHRGSRRCVHTPEFKRAEKQFERLREARELIRKL
jgi:hypothetical protein